MSEPAKVSIDVRRGDGAEANWEPLDLDARSMFNPSEYTLEKNVQLADIAIPGLDAPLTQFVRGQHEKLTLELFFDTTESGTAGPDVRSVTTETDKVYQLVQVDPATHAPPVCRVVWGENFPGDSGSSGSQRRYGFQCVAERIRQQFTLFSREGVPLRATLTVTLREYKTLDQQLAQQNPSSPDRMHGHAVERGETLSRIAGRYYRRPGEWRAIAAENGIEDPRRLQPGTLLTVPPIR